MKRVTRGFTVIETMLFLAVSGALAAGVLVTVGSTIGSQRYRDAVDSFASYIQGQYSQAINVRNDVGMHDACVGASFSTTERQEAGTSENCSIIGRIVTSSNGADFSSAPVYMSGLSTTFLQSNVGDDTVFSSSSDRQLFIKDSFTDSQYTLDWDTRTVAPTSGSNSWSIAILRSPISGVIHTYTSREYTDSVSKLQSLVKDANRQNDTVVCIDSSGWTTWQTLGITILADAPGASSVTTGTEGC